MSKNEEQSTADFPGQYEDEEVKVLFRRHPLVMRRPLIFGLLAILVAIVPMDFPDIYKISWLPGALLIVLAIAVLIVLMVWALAFISWYYTIYIITNRRLVFIEQKGFFNRSFQEWQLDRIYNVNYRVSGLQAVIFGYGDIVAKTIAGELVIGKIYHPGEIHRALMLAVREADPGDQAVDNTIIPV